MNLASPKPIRFFLIPFFICTLIFSSFGQKMEDFSSLKDIFYQCDVLRIDAPSAYSKTKGKSYDIVVDIPISGKTTLTLDLERSGILKDDYELLIADENGVRVGEGTTAVPTQGYIRGVPDSRVSLTFNENFIYGFIKNGEELFFIEPLMHFEKQADPGLFVVYTPEDVKPVKDNKCGLSELQHQYKRHSERDYGNEVQRMTGLCFEIDYAIANDFSMFDKYGSVSGVQNHAIGVTNNIQTNYDDEFPDELQFIITTQFVVTTSNGDPWTSSTSASALLNSFADWGPSGFGAPHDIASLWTDRNFNGPTIGIAFVGVVCTGGRYNCLQDFSSNANLKRVMVAHEIGHNFDALHDTGGGFIMSPSVNNTTTWSTTSINDIEAHYLSRTCLAACSGSGSAPAADFDYTIEEQCTPGEVEFTDLSTNAPTSWLWTFPGGTPASSTEQNPVVFYLNPGVYEATLVASNAIGSDTYSIGAEIEILDAPIADFNHSIVDRTVTFTNTSTGADGYFWEFGDGDDSSEENPVHTYDEDGEYEVLLFVANDCGNDIFTVTITIATPPVAGFTADVTDGCNPLEVNFSSEASNNTIEWFWEFEGGTPATSGEENPVVTYEEAGLFDVTLTVVNPTGTDVLTKADYIEINASPEPAFTYTVDGPVVTFTNQSQFSNSYSWDFGDGNTSTETSPVHEYASTNLFTVTLTATNDCGDVTFSEEILVVLGPTANFSASSTEGCVPFEVTFENSSSVDPNTYEWTFEGGSPATSSEASPVVNYNTTGSFDVELIVVSTSGTDTLKLEDYIVVNDIPVSGFNFNTAILSVDFENTSVDADSYTWEFGDGQTSTEENPTHTYTEEGTYSVCLTASNDCGDEKIIQEITVIDVPQASFSAANPNDCAPALISFTDNSSSNITSWEWTFEGGDPATSSDQNPEVTYATPGVYDVTLTVTNVSGSNQAVMEDYIVIEAGPTPDFDYNANLTNVQFNNTSQNANSYSWDFGDGETSTEENPEHDFPGEGTYTVVLTATNDCGDEMISQEITVIALPTAGFEASATSGCFPLTVEFSDQSSSNVTEWAWTFEGGTPATSSEQSPSVTYENAGTFDVQLIVTSAAGQNTLLLEDHIIIEGPPVAGISYDLNGNVIDLTSNSQGGSSFTWSVDGNNFEGQTATYTFPENGEYDVVLEVTNDCGVDEITETITIDVYPNSAFSASLEEGCLPFEVEFTDESTMAASWEWTFEGGNPANSTEQNPVVIYETQGTYSVTLKVTNQYGESILEESELISVLTEPVSSFNYTLNGPNFEGMNTSTGATSYAWDFGDGNTSTEENPEHIYAESGEYQVSLTTTNVCGTNTYIVDITVIANSPVVSISSSGDEGCTPFTVMFTDMSTNNPTEWAWEFEGGDPAVSSERNPTVVYNSTGIFDVKLTATNAAGSSSLLLQEYISVFTTPTAEYSYEVEGGMVTFEYTGTGALSYMWDFGDGNSSNEANPTHEYTASGEYRVVLTVSNECGETTISEDIIIIISDVEDIDWLDKIDLYPNPNTGFFTISMEGLTVQDLDISMVNILGQKVYSTQENLISPTYKKEIRLDNTVPGTYLVQIRSGKDVITRKVLILD